MGFDLNPVSPPLIRTMNRTTRDVLTLVAISFIGNLIFFSFNPTKTHKDKTPVTAGLIGIAYCIGRRRDG